MMKNLARALRLPFLTASILPFIFGSLITSGSFNLLGFVWGLLAVVATHLSANLINDYADSRTKADWQDKNFYKFFGGSKLIQQGIFREGFYLKAAISFALLGVMAVIFLALVKRSPMVVWLYILIIFLSWSYSHWPLRFSYHRLGEIFIFVLFGPVIVMGGYYIQSSVFPDLRSFLLSLPFGFLTTAILFSNEVPDYKSDKACAKFNWVSLVGPEGAYFVYFLLIGLGLLAILINVLLGYLKSWALISFLAILPAIKAGIILKRFPADKNRLVESSKLTIAIHSLVSLIIILEAIL